MGASDSLFSPHYEKPFVVLATSIQLEQSIHIYHVGLGAYRKPNTTSHYFFFSLRVQTVFFVVVLFMKKWRGLMFFFVPPKVPQVT